MTSVEPEREDGTSLKAVGSPAVSDSGVSNGSSTCLSESGAHIIVTETSAASAKPSSALNTPSDDPGVVATAKRTSFLSLDGHLTEKGLSCLSLEVCASGENINLLTQEDLSGCASGPGSMGSLEGELESVELGSDGEVAGKKEEGEDEMSGDGKGSLNSEQGAAIQSGEGSRRGSEAPPEVLVRTSPSNSSRCSSSMGYLEPRPSSQPPTDSQQQALSAKDVQKQLMEKVVILTTPSPDTANGEEDASESRSEVGAEDLPGVSLPTSHSSQSLDKAGGIGGAQNRRFSLGNFLQRRKSGSKTREHSHQAMAASSTTGLILNQRPKTLPAKTEEELKRHQQQHQKMMAAARKKELQKAKEELKKEKLRRERDKMVADSIKEWEKILPKWEELHNSRKVHDLWWAGLPPGIRGKVWKKAIGNDLNVSSDLYVINLKRCKERLATARERTDSNTSRKSVSREQSVEVIHLDLLRTFPTLGFFQEGGPYHDALYDILGAYACYRPDIGYVQGMSFLAAVLLLNMDASDAFICLANLLNLTSYLAFFKVDHALMLPYFRTFQVFLQDALPRLSTHFETLAFTPEFYLIEWIFTIYTRTLPLDVACRVWDMFCRDGDSFLFRTAIGILKLFQNDLLSCRSLEELGQFLGNLPAVESDILFTHIESIHLAAKKFRQVLSQEQKRPSDSAPTIV